MSSTEAFQKVAMLALHVNVPVASTVADNPDPAVVEGR
jgi:hypothetical protein